MNNILKLVPGRTYKLVKAFEDYDGIIHPIDETWTYQGTNFLPYDDGLTLHVLVQNESTVYRLQWREDAQAHIIEHFREYVEQID